ncbi:ABC transporter substrate-binding protein [Dactylosporangium sp. CS-047395]|uniref:ABC transporter substrate-binding protein n=1 Tax=Dactylosporangium sp. CS-047395 TaxID=3239936 RepID=UPI003D8B2BF5
MPEGAAMDRYRALVLTGLLLTAASCQRAASEPRPPSPSGFNAGLTGTIRPSANRGGTLHLGTSLSSIELDPARSWNSSEWNAQRLYTRTLLTAAPRPGIAGTVLVPDLATAMPEVSADGLTYRFTLRAGVRFETGEPITAQDVKYGIERAFAQDVLSGGPTYLIDRLDQGQQYPGPYRDPAPDRLGLRSVETPDPRTIVFHLAEPFAQFPYLLAMGTAAPVPAAADTGDKYGSRPVSSGPYKFTVIDQGRRIALARNSAWDPTTDPVRTALPDEINLTMGLAPDEVDAQLLDGTLDLSFDQIGLQPGNQAKVLLDPARKANTDEPYTGSLGYAAINVHVSPFDNVHCRRAVQYATDKTAVQTAQGGPDAGGDIATDLLPPAFVGHSTTDRYQTASGRPQLDKARAELRECGHPDGFTTVLTVVDRPRAVRVAEAIQQSLAAAGIDAKIRPLDQSTYFRSDVGSPDNVHRNGYGIILSNWAADYPSPQGFLPLRVDGRTIRESGNNNYAELDDPEVNRLIDAAARTTAPDEVAAAWRQVDDAVMDTATMLPLVFQKAFNYRSPRLTNVYVSGYYGGWDLCTLGVA